MRPVIFAALGIALLGWSGCASIKISTSRDPGAPIAEFRTYAWATTLDDPSEGRSATFRRHARSLVEAALARKGYKKTAPGQSPDALVRFYAFVEEETGVVSDSGEIQAPESTLPPGIPTAEELAARHAREPSKETNESDEGEGVEVIEVDNLEVGDLVLDLVDQETMKLAWRVWARGFADPDKPDAELEKALDVALTDLPHAESR